MLMGKQVLSWKNSVNYNVLLIIIIVLLPMNMVKPLQKTNFIHVQTYMVFKFDTGW